MVAFDSADWKFAYERDGIRVWTQSVQGRPILAVKGEGLIQASASVLVNLLLDSEHKTKWLDHFFKTKQLFQSELKLIEYAAYKTPIMVADRDFVFQYEAFMDEENGGISVDMKSVSHPDAPKTIGVRGDLRYAKFCFLPMDGGASTLCRVSWVADPCGRIPSVLINQINRDFPVNTIIGVRRFVASNNLPAHPLVDQMLVQLEQESGDQSKDVA